MQNEELDELPQEQRKAGHKGGVVPLGKAIGQMAASGEIPRDPRSWRYHAFQDLMKGCARGSEACRPKLDGWLVLESGDRHPCEIKTFSCEAGRRLYVQACQSHLEGLGFGGDQSKACFLRRNEDHDAYDPADPFTHHAFILDDCSRPAMEYAFDGGFERRSSLILAGGTGPGKTYATLALMAHLRVAGNIESQMFVKAEQLIDDYMTDKMRETLDRAMRTRLLALDDLGTELPSARNEKNLYSLIDTRLSAGLPTIVTMNMDAQAFMTRYSDKRLQDRFKLFQFIETSLKSKRRAR